MDNEILCKILDEMTQIKKYLAVIAHDRIALFNEDVAKSYLTTESRKRMYDLFDGLHSHKEISEEIGGITAEAVRQFAVILEKDGIIEYVIDGKSKFPKRIF